MRVTVVPAQVTTLEDRIAGKLGLSQLLLLALPLFAGSLLFTILPPVMHNARYKLVLIGLLSIISGVLAIRIKGTIILRWLMVLLRYDLRPRYYVYDKRTLHGRQMYQNGAKGEPDDKPKPVQRTAHEAAALTSAEAVRLQNIIEDPAAQLWFEVNKKGRLYGRATKIKQEV